MKSRFMITSCVGLLLLLAAVPPATYAAVPNQINYQGLLTDSDGNTVPDRDYDMLFTIWNAATGGDALWSEDNTVTVTNGIYNVTLGQDPLGNPFPENLFEGQRWLGVAVGVDGVYDPEMEPRQLLTSTPFALKAAKAEDSDTLDGKDSTEFSETTHSHSFSDISGTATDDQIPDNITINHAATAGSADSATHADSADSAAHADSADSAAHADSAGDADTVDGKHASDFASSSHNHDTRYYTKDEMDLIIQGYENRITELEAKLERLTVSADGNDITISGANLHIVNGTDTTAGTPNGLGNLIVGYNDVRDYYSCSLGQNYSDQASCEAAGGLWWMNDKTGSHNLVVGDRHNYWGYGGIVVGYQNTIAGAYCSVSGGVNNTACDGYSSVSGGYENTASGYNASVSGGRNNTASASYTSVSGGYENTTSGYNASVSGGRNNIASASYSSVSGGYENTASGEYASSISGGYNNEASGEYASVSGGRNNTASNNYASVSGGYGNTVSGNTASVSGGYENTASGECASVSGGSHNTASGEYASSVSGGMYNTASGEYASVSAGSSNTASGPSSIVSGGRFNEASGSYSSVVGGGSNNLIYGNHAYANYSAILGGKYNITGDPELVPEDHTVGELSTISGGDTNRASGTSSTVSGGKNNTASGYVSSVVGGGSDNPVYGNHAYANYSAILGGIYNIAGSGNPELDPNHTVGERSTISGGDTNRTSGTSSTVSGGVDNHAFGVRSTVGGGAHLTEDVNEGYKDPDTD